MNDKQNELSPMNSKLDELGALLKNHAQSAESGSDDQDALDFAEFLRAAIESKLAENAETTRVTLAEAAGISAAKLYALERSLIAIIEMEKEELLGLAEALDEDPTFFALLTGRDDLVSIENKTASGKTTTKSDSPFESEYPSERFKLSEIDSHTFSNIEPEEGVFEWIHRNGQLPRRELFARSIRKMKQEQGQHADENGRTSSGRFRMFRNRRVKQAGVMGSLSVLLVLVLFIFYSSRAILPDGLAMTQIVVTPTQEIVMRQSESRISNESSAPLLREQFDSMKRNEAFPEDGMPDLLSEEFPLDDMFLQDDSFSDTPPATTNNWRSTLADAFKSVQSSLFPPRSTEKAIQASQQIEPQRADSVDLAEPLSSSHTQRNLIPTQVPLPPPTATPAPTTQRAIPMPNTMIFQDYGTNPFVATAQDNLSTFAIDVDTGSYTVARRYVNDGLLPPPEAVRIEEFVNYFDYDYSYPTKEELFAIYMDAAPVPFASHSSGAAEMVRIGIQGYDVAPAERADLALTFVIDVSGSMGNENRLTLVKRSLTLLVEELRPTDSVGIVAYSTTAREVLPPTQASQKNRILDAIFALQPENSTNAAAGLRLGYTMAWNHFQPRSINRVILASDGVANVDVTNAADIWEQIKQYAARGITLTTIGVGMGNYNDVLMEQLADTGDGFYAYVDTIEEAEQLFVHDLTGTLQTIAKDAKIQVEFDPEVVSHYRLLGYENREVADVDFRNDAVDAGEVGAGHSVTALYEIRRYPNAIGRIATTHLRWQDPASHQIFEMTETLDSRAIAASFENAPLNFQLAVAVAEYAQSLRNSMAIDGRPSHRSLSSVLLVEAIRIGEALNNKANRSHAADQTGGEIDDVTEWVNLIQKTHAIMRNMATTSARAPISRDAFEYPLPTSADAFSVALPPAWSNKILFLSDRTGRTETWMMDPAANFRISQVSESWIHALAQEQRAFAPDGRAKLLTRTDANGGLQIHIHDFASNAIRPLTVLRGANHDPVWSPRGDWIYFVSSASGVDEIMRTNRAGNLFERLTVSDMSDHPSVSPDGQSIIFHSTRETGRQQLWIMNADGSNLRNLSNSSRNDWDPVWTR